MLALGFSYLCVALAGCSLEGNEGSDPPGTVEASPEKERLSLRWMRFTFEVYLLDRLLAENAQEDLIDGSSADPYRTSEEGNAVAETNFDFLAVSGVLEEGQGGYSVITDVDFDQVVVSEPPQARSPYPKVLSSTVNGVDRSWCQDGKDDSTLSPVEYVETFQDAHQTEDEAREHMQEYIDSCGAST